MPITSDYNDVVAPIAIFNNKLFVSKTVIDQSTGLHHNSLELYSFHGKGATIE